MPQRWQFITHTFQTLLSRLKWDNTFANRALLLLFPLRFFFFPFKVKRHLKRAWVRLSSQFMLSELLALSPIPAQKLCHVFLESCAQPGKWGFLFCSGIP